MKNEIAGRSTDNMPCKTGEDGLTAAVKQIANGLSSSDCDRIIHTIKQIADREHAFECEKLLISLNQGFYNDSEFQILLDFVDRGSTIDTRYIKIASRYLDFFEPFYNLIKKGYLEMEQVDDMFAYRFFAIVNNGAIQKLLVEPHSIYYGNICRLHKIWVSYRESKGNTQRPYQNTDLSKKSWYNDMCKDA